MISNEHIDRLLAGQGNVVGTDGGKIGGVGQVYADDDTGQPNWVTVKTGLFGTRESFVPLEGARVDGDDIVVPYTKDQVKDAPGVDPDGHLDPAEEDRLYQHYSLGNGHRSHTDATTGTAGGYRNDADAGVTGGYRGDADTGTDKDYDARGTVGRDTSGPTTDDAMTRSEERLNVGTERQATGRARLRKYVISEEEHEVTLHEERPVVEKETVPVERVRLDKDTVTEQETVTEEVRKERIDADGLDET